MDSGPEQWQMPQPSPIHQQPLLSNTALGQLFLTKAELITHTQSPALSPQKASLCHKCYTSCDRLAGLAP